MQAAPHATSATRLPAPAHLAALQRRARCVPQATLVAHLMARAVVMLALKARTALMPLVLARPVLKARTALSALYPALRVARASAPRARALREPVQRRARCVPRATKARVFRGLVDALPAPKAPTAPPQQETATRALPAVLDILRRVLALLDLMLQPVQSALLGTTPVMGFLTSRVV